MATIRYWAISGDFLDDSSGPEPYAYKDLGALAHHLWIGDAVLRSHWDFDDRFASIDAVGGVTSADPTTEFASIDWRPASFTITPGPNGRRHWATKPHFILSAKRVRAYEFPERLARAFDDDAWLHHRISDAYPVRNPTGERLPSLERREGFVYLMASEGEYKIGKAVDIERRRKRLELELQRDIEVLHAIHCDDYSQAEWDLHKRFADKRTHGEWFDLDPDDIEWFLSKERF